MVGKTKIKKDLIVHFNIKRSKSISVTNFVEEFVNSWLSHLLSIQSDECRWRYIKFKLTPKSSYLSFPLSGLYRRCKGFAIEYNKAFKLVISCKFNLYLFLIYFVPSELMFFDKTDVLEEIKMYQFKERVGSIESKLVHSFVLTNNLDCEMLFVKRLRKGKNISYREIDFAFGNPVVVPSKPRKSVKVK